MIWSEIWNNIALKKNFSKPKEIVWVKLSKSAISEVFEKFKALIPSKLHKKK